MARDPWKAGLSSGAGGTGGTGGSGGRRKPVPGRFDIGRLAPVGRLLGDGENPLRWGLPLGSIAGVRVRLHWLFVFYVLAQVIFTLPRHQIGVGFTLPLMGAFLVLVGLHEAAHCWLCRRLGGEADEVVMWPLGGLAWCRPVHAWRAEFATAAAGPASNLLLMVPITGGLIWATGEPRLALLNPLDLGGSVLAIESAYGSMPWWLVGLWALHIANTALLAFNLLAPMYPSDSARMVQSVLWARVGYHRSLWITAHLGIAVGAILATAGLVLADGKAVFAVGLFGVVVCWLDRRRLQFLAGVEPGVDTARVAPVDSVIHPGRNQAYEEEEVEEGEETDTDGAVQEAAADRGPSPGQRDEVDRVLAKISRVGLNGLTRGERAILKRATERSRETSE